MVVAPSSQYSNPFHSVPQWYQVPHPSHHPVHGAQFECHTANITNYQSPPHSADQIIHYLFEHRRQDPVVLHQGRESSNSYINSFPSHVNRKENNNLSLSITAVTTTYVTLSSRYTYFRAPNPLPLEKTSTPTMHLWNVGRISSRGRFTILHLTLWTPLNLVFSTSLVFFSATTEAKLQPSLIEATTQNGDLQKFTGFAQMARNT